MPIGNKNSGGGGGGGKDVRAGGAYFELWARDAAIVDTLEKVKKKVAQFGSFMAKVGKTAGVAGASLAAPLTLLFRGGFNRAADIGRMADELQIPIDLMARLQHAAEDAGVSVQDVMNDTEGRFDSLIDRPSGIDPKQIMQAVAAQRAMSEATRALQYALLPLLDTITPIVMRIAEFAKENAALLRVVAPVAAGLIAISAAATALGPGLMLLVGGGGLVVRLAVGLFSLLKVLAAVRVAMIATAVKVAMIATVKFLWLAVTTLLSGGLAILSAAVSFLLSPIGLVTVAALALAYVFRDDLKSAGSEIGQFLGDTFRSLADIFNQTFRGIVDAVKAGDLELAFRIMGQGIRTFWAQLLVSLATAWNNFVQKVAESVKKNRAMTALIGAGAGATAGGLVGGLPGFLIGGVGGAGGGLLAGEFADDIAGAVKIDVAGLGGKLGGERAKLNALVGEAAKKAADADKFLNYGRQAAAAWGSVKGNFSTYGTAKNQFGYGNDVNKQTALQQRIADAAEGTEKGVKDLADGLKPK